MDCTATQHAYSMAKDRLGWKRSTLDRMMPRAFSEGMTHCEARGRLRRFLDRKWQLHRSCNNVRIYGENVLFFSGTTLVTLYRLDNQLIKNIKK